MNAATLFDRPAFVPPLGDLAAWRGGNVIGLSGGGGVLGGLLRERLQQRDFRVENYAGDINDTATLSAWFGGRTLSHFFHFAALVPVTEVEADPLLAYQTNVMGAFNICRELLRTQPDCWFFHCSSSHVYQPTGEPRPLAEEAPTLPPTFYGDTKLAAERVVTALFGKLGRPYCIGRVFSFTHPSQSPPYLVPSLQERIARLGDGDTLEVQNPGSIRDIQDAEHVIDAILNLAIRRVTGIVNIGTGIGLSVREIALQVARAMGRDIRVSGIDGGASGALIADTTRLKALLSL